MIIGIIDIGSNSIRLMLSDNGRTISKSLESPRISEGLAFTGELKKEKMELATKVIVDFKKDAIAKGAKKVFIFATEAVRAASNRDEFIDMVYKATDIRIDVVSSDVEAKLGFRGAYIGDSHLAVVDIGGASTEISVGDKDGIYYSMSLPIGCVRMKNKCGENDDELDEYIGEMMERYGDILKVKEAIFVAGTASAVATIKLGLPRYDAKEVDNLYITRQDLESELDLLRRTPMEEREQIPGMPRDRVDILYGGIKLILGILSKLELDGFYFSDRDNLEGYFKYLVKRGDIVLD